MFKRRLTHTHTSSFQSQHHRFAGARDAQAGGGGSRDPAGEGGRAGKPKRWLVSILTALYDKFMVMIQILLSPHWEY